MHTKDMLAEALRGVGLADMAERAASGHYHDYLSPLDLPEMTLLQDLADAARTSPNRDPIMALRRRVMAGDYDASAEESDEWAASPEGQAAFRRLMDGS
ncbi:hypothetical protein [Bradyrhizobium japonicum]|uniref:hypothetical protein n=1 Tax=Bradyrhizobium japonicum TaxID=375 RepID=UPI00200F786C|nr:hypothetical protein [Bradyrhizobium japonicum]UQD96121.1 hypothetical protein JEY30_31765 [Bradyrhizobium japonicum]